MGNIFRNFSRDPMSSDDMGSCVAVVKETVVSGKDHSEFVVNKLVDQNKFAECCDLPTADEYSLENMLKCGDVPREVPCTGMLNPTDDSDPRVAAELSAMADELHSLDENFNLK